MSGELSLHATTPRQPSAGKAPVLSLKVGAHVGGYVIVAPLGVGGMGRVFIADDPQLARRVALKILPPEDADDEGRARFLREAHALARVRHKNVVQVYASGIDEAVDVAWMALEYVEGDPLGALVEAGPIDEETALSLCAQAARGLAAVHEVGVVHRDVKPDNLLLDGQGSVRVLDFGVALLLEGAGRGGFVTTAGVAVGTPHFMAPEQARGGPIDVSADAWGLAATLVTLLTGKPPFYVRDDEPDLDILARVLRERAPDVRSRAPRTTAATAGIVARMLDPDPATRLADMIAIARQCEAIADAIAAGEPAPLPPSSLEKEPPPPVPPSASSAAPVAPPAAPAPSYRGVVAVALLFAGLGALVASQLARPASPVAPSPATPPVATSAAPLPPAPPAEPASPPSAAPGFSGAPAATRQPDEPASPDGVDEAAPLTALELAAAVVADPSPRGAVRELVARDDDDARAAVVRLAVMPGAPGDATVNAIAALEARAHIGALAAALKEGDRAALAIDVLVALRPFEALALLDDAARTHPDQRIRARAAAARAGLFRVEGQ